MKRTLTFLFLCVSLVAYAQPEGRVFTISNQTYTNLSNSTVITNQGWDDFDTTVPLGFNFTLFGQSNDSLFFNSDFNLGADFALTHDGTTQGVGMFTDLVDRSSIPTNAPSVVSYKVDVVNSKKIAKLEWRNAGFLGELGNNSTTDDSVNFQIWLYENNNEVEVHFGSSSIVSDYADIFTFEKPLVVFIKNANAQTQSLDWLYYVSSTTTPKVDSINLVGLITANTLGYDTWPSSGTVFRFAKPTLGVNSIKLNDYTSVYPTAITTQCTVDITKNNFNGYVALLDMQGKTVKLQQASTGKNVLDLSGLATGSYTLNIRNSEESVFYKIVKQ